MTGLETDLFRREDYPMVSGLFAFVGRVMLALIFIISGAQKLGDIAGTGQYMAGVGLPAAFALPAALFELIGGLAIALGFVTRLLGLIFAGFCLLTALLFHRDFADPMQATSALKNIAMAGGFLCLFAYDQKSWSFDAYRARRRDAAAARNASTIDNPGIGAG
jgi:putative oxidoreductase